MKGDLVTRLLLETQLFDDNLAKATQSVKGFSQLGLGLSSVLGGLKGVVGKLAIGIGAATTATEAFNKTIASSQTLTDNFAIVTELATSVVDSFFNSLATGDFSGFLSGLSNVIDAAREASIALDDLATHLIFNNPKYAKFDLRLAEITRTLRNPKSTEALKAQARRDLDLLNKERTLAALDDANAYSKAFFATFNKNLAKNGASKRWAKVLIGDILRLGEDYYKWNSAQIRKLEKQLSRERTTVAADPIYGSGRTDYIYTKRGKQIQEELRARRALAETSDLDLQTSMQFAAEAYRSQAKAINLETAGYRAYYKGLTGGRSRGGTRGGITPHQRTVEEKSALQLLVDEVNNLIKLRDYKIQLGINTDLAKKEIDKLQKDINSRLRGILNIGTNLLYNGSANQLSEFIRVLTGIRDNSNSKEDYNGWNDLIVRFLNGLDRLTGKVGLIIPELSKFQGEALGGADDISLFRVRLRELQKDWDEVTKKLNEINLKGVKESDFLLNQIRNRKELIREGEPDHLMDQYLTSLEIEEFYKRLTGRERYMISADEELVAQLKDTLSKLALGIQSLERSIITLSTRGVLGLTNWYDSYKYTDRELLTLRLAANTEQVEHISQIINLALLENASSFKYETTIPAQYRDMVLSAINEGLYNDIFKSDELELFKKQLEDSLDNSYSDASISFDMKRTKLELELMQKFITSTLSELQYIEVFDHIANDISDLQSKLDSLQFNTVIDGTNAIFGLGDSFESLTSVLESNASVWKKVSSTVSALLGIFTTIQRVIEGFNLISEVTDSLNNAKSVAGEVIEAIDFYGGQAEELALNTTAALTNALASSELTTKKTEEAAAHTFNAGAIASEAASYAALTTSQTTATAATIALYLAAKKAAAAQIFLAHASIPFAGVGIATGLVAEMEGVLASLNAFANGGIVGGNSYSGDKILARLNSGEMVLNRTQQGNLFNTLNNGIGGTRQVEFKIRGKDLVGVINNYNDKLSKVR